MIERSPKYKPLYTTDKRYTVVTGGRGSAKSFEVATFLNLLTYESLHRILFTRYTMTSAHLSIIPEFTEKIELLEVGHHFEVTKRRIINKNTGSDILFSGLKASSGNQTANLKSLQGVSTWVLDEAEELEDEDTFDKIDQSVRNEDVQNRIITILNPTTFEHFIWKRWFEDSHRIIEVDGFQIPISTHPEVEHIHTTYLDNKNLPQDYLRLIHRLREEDPKKYAHQFLGKWVDKPEGVIFEHWVEGEFNNELQTFYGLDYGYNPDPTALIQVAIDRKRRKLYLKELAYATDLNTNQIAEMLSNNIPNNGLIIAESAEKRLNIELINKGFNIVPTVKGADSVRHGLKQMLNFEIIVDPGSANLKKELNNYVWSDKKAGVAADQYNHLIDAARYAVRYYCTVNAI